jgi:S-DNA-T family DNA segregation ATPase FtsK/SpoIIIE
MADKPPKSNNRKQRKESLPSRSLHLDEQGADWLDRLVSLEFHFGRFARDASGVILLALAAMILLALLGGSKGVVLAYVTEKLLNWFGWGSYLLAISVGFLGIVLMRREKQSLSLGRIIAFEIALLLSLSLLAAISTISGNALESAVAGQFGGVIGWGLAYFAWKFAGFIWGTVILVVIWLLAIMSSFGLWQTLEGWLSRLAGDTADVEAGPASAVPPETVSAPASPVKSKKKKPSPLPPEFRKSLRVPESQDSRPAEPLPRSADLPVLSILSAEQISRPDERTINQTAGMIEKTLSEFGIPATVIGFRVGPTVTQFAVQPGFIKRTGSTEEDAQQMKVRVAQIAALQKDLALALSAQRLRIQAPVPGKPFVGIEVPNSHASVVRLRSILETDAFYKVKSPLAIALGRDVSGQPIVADLARMPHLLIAGATGSGKSVCITALAACLAMNNSPEELRLVMIDSKMVELLRFNGLPHLYSKVETNIDRIMGVLRWVVAEMDHRYRLLESVKARDLDSYNSKLVRRGEGSLVPRIIVIIDELADLMMSAPDQTEHNLVRLAQMARATGIHLVVATQRPSTDVVTGLIKANFPARLAFAVVSSVDSRVILDTSGAETLLGRGDMLFLNPEVGNSIRAQGVMVTDEEIENIITHWQKVSTIRVDDIPPWEKFLQEPSDDGEDVLIGEAIALVQEMQRASASLLQRRLRIGYPRAARLLDQLEEMGIVGPSQGGGREREVLIDPDIDMDNVLE